MSVRSADRIAPAVREKILNLWRDGMTSALLSERFAMSRGCIEYVVSQAREAGDVRAVRRHKTGNVA